MPIQVVCPGCKKRFNVSEKFAGKEGPCPSCKTKIKIPEATPEVKIHGPEDEAAGPPGSPARGQPVFKPIRREHLTVSPVVLVSVIGGILVVFVAALLIGWGRGPEKPVPAPILALGAMLLAPPLAWGGYIFLRDPELQPYRGTQLYIRVGICAAVYALLWGAFAILKPLWLGGSPVELWHLVIILPALVGCGALAAFASLDLEFTTAAFHYGLYLGVTVLLRVIMNLPAL